jgi:2-oxoglutarate dehydrogenase E2 component (dihydrolipoamide succinyltransferase)
MAISTQTDCQQKDARMPTPVIMPQLGESVVEGTVARWLIAEGQPVAEYEPLLAVTTDKVDTEIPAPASGVLLKIHVAEGQTVAKGTLLAEIGAAGAKDAREAPPRSTGDEAASAAARQASTPLAQRVAAEHGLDLAQVPGTGPGGRVTREDVAAYLAATGEEAASAEGTAVPGRSLGFISPAVGRLAAELGVDLAQVIGTGTGGRITRKDILAYVATPVSREAGVPAELPPWERPGTGDLFKPTEEVGKAPSAAPAPTTTAPAPGEQGIATPDDAELSPLSAIRRSIARHMVLSKQTSPHVTTVMEADLMRVVKARERLKGEFERQGVRLTFTPFFVQAIVAGLKAVPAANSSFADTALVLHKRVHIGMAVAIPDGLIVPVIRDADEKSLLGLARAVSDLAERARTKRLAPDEVQGGTFTLTNHGTSGSLFATPIINQPQAGILGVGAIQKRPIVIAGGHPLLPDAEDTLAIRPMAYLSFTFDHRILDGQGADGFLVAVKRFLEDYRE